jgi:hypothetical protein
MSEKDNPDPLNRPAGLVSLAKYMGHGGGMELFRAYVEQRRATRQANSDRKAEIIQAMSSGLSIEASRQADGDLLEIRILEELDPVIEDLLKVCAGKTQGNERLVELHSALRIGDGRAPSDSTQTEYKWAMQQRWIDAYLIMQETGIFRSENSIADEIAADFGVSRSTAINHWREKKKAQPWQGQWASEIALRTGNRIRRADRPTKKAPPSKRRNRITFGRERVTR